MTKEEILENLKRNTEAVCSTFEKPDDDFDPVAFVWTGSGEQCVVPLAIDKEYWGVAVRKICEMVDAEAAAAVLSAWTSSQRVIDPEEQLKRIQELGGVSNLPENEREEQVLIIVVDEDGPMFSACKLVRFKDDPPILGSFEDMTGEVQINVLKDVVEYFDEKI